jgi:hypothetical protein
MSLLCNNKPERNMTDKELLEAAARAAGIAGTWVEALRCFELVGFDNCINHWSPLTDDGDALRMAVKLDIDFYMGADSGGPEAWAGYYLPGRENKKHACVSVGSDPYAATRRAIVRAAAEIGSLHNAIYPAL